MAKATKKIPVQSVRVYLLKQSVRGYRDAIRDDVSVVPYDLAPGLGVSGCAFIRQSISKELRWLPFLQAGLATKLPAMSAVAHAAAVFLEIDGRILVLVFGMGRYLLKDTSYEADFGIITVLNSVDPSGLRSADTFQFEAVGVHKRIQTSRTTTLSEFAIDTTREQVRSVTGVAKSKLLADRVTGTEGAFGANLRINFKDLVETSRSLLAAFRAKDYKQAFPHFDKLRRVTDKQKIAELEEKLVKKLRSRNTDGIHLSPPAPIEYDDFSGFSFSEKGDIHDELTVADYVSSRSDPGALDLDAVKRHRVYLRKETVEEPLARWSGPALTFCFPCKDL